jgi:hypothetical protein
MITNVSLLQETSAPGPGGLPAVVWINLVPSIRHSELGPHE